MISWFGYVYTYTEIIYSCDMRYTNVITNLLTIHIRK